MRGFLFPLAALLALPLYAQVAAPETTLKLSARAERATAVYHPTEKVTFRVKLEEQNVPVAGGEIEWTLLKDGLPLREHGKVPIQNGEAEVSGQLQGPGFLQLRASYRPTAEATPVTILAGAAIDPTDIKPSLPVPEDFDAFWTAQKQKLALVPGHATFTPVPSPTKGLETFDVQADCVGAPVSGYFARPAGAAPKSLPIILNVHAAGVRSSGLRAATSWAAKGFLAMDINAHGLPNGRPDSFYTEQAEGALKGYRTAGRESRDTVYFLGMFLRLVRAIDVLTAEPEWDGKTVVVYGSSQGGYQAIAASALDSRVTFFAAGVPAGCDHSGLVVNRSAGWPKLVPFGEDGKPDPEVLEVARYFDAMNFATRSKAAGCAFTVGFVDATCPPTSVYAAYNNLTIPKQIYNDVTSGHAHSADAVKSMRDAVMRHIEEQKLK